jgi:hypothetical protein
MTRFLIRLLLALSLLFAFAAVIVAFWLLGPADPTAWTIVAAALAVFAAVASAWTSQRVLELQEDAQEPDPVPTIDLRSRYMLAQFRITNHGGTSAHRVKVVWQKQLKDAKGAEVLLGRDAPIPVIPRGESASVLLGGSLAFFGANADTTCGGTVSFENASGRRYSKQFIVSGEHERTALVDDKEGPKTEKELQRIPSELEGIADQIKQLTAVLRKSS